jgi:hypothetical protein
MGDLSNVASKDRPSQYISHISRATLLQLSWAGRCVGPIFPVFGLWGVVMAGSLSFANMKLFAAFYYGRKGGGVIAEVLEDLTPGTSTFSYHIKILFGDINSCPTVWFAPTCDCYTMTANRQYSVSGKTNHVGVTSVKYLTPASSTFI